MAGTDKNQIGDSIFKELKMFLLRVKEKLNIKKEKASCCKIKYINLHNPYV